ncbi:hypothetical protein ACFL6C_13675 [Myxococcota bacterium]
MPSLPPAAENVSPSTDAALLLAALPRLRALGLPHPTAKQVIEATGARRSRAYELRAHLEARLQKLVRAPGRPPKSDTVEATVAAPDIMRKVLEYVWRHPGCVVAGDDRRSYSVDFRQFILEFLAAHRDITVEGFANASTIPLGTIKDWLRGGTQGLQPVEQKKATFDLGARGPQLETVLAEWSQWKGPFTAFCDHVQLHCRIPFGRTLISTILEAHGVRTRTRRPGRSPDEQALRGAFETFFPHAQWVGDGTVVLVRVDDQVFEFNVQLDVDAYSDSFLGADVSDVEDSAAVIDATLDANEQAGTLPIALLLDNKPCNHTDELHAALGDTIVIPATVYRGQNKAHIEGGFGLLKPTLEGLSLDTSSPRELARSFLRGLVVTWGRTINHRARRDRGGRSRVDLLEDLPTPEQVDQARQALQERLRKQEKKRQTEAARQNPVVRETITAAHQRLALDDPYGNELTATARYPLVAIVEAIAIFEGRQRAGTLPAEKSTARYLRGIARNIAEEREGWEIALALWDARVAAGDLVARQLNLQRSTFEATVPQPDQLTKVYIDQALQTPSRLDRFFWLTAAADLIRDTGDPYHAFRLAARRIAATHSTEHRQRLAATRFLAAKVLPIQ